MTNRFITYFSTALLLHFGLFLGGGFALWNLDTPKELNTQLIKVSVATHMLMGRTAPHAPVAKKTTNSAVVKPTRPTAASSTAEVAVTSPATGAYSSGEGIVGASNLSGAASGDLRNTYQSELRSLIDSKVIYPALSRRLGQTGLVKVAFTLLQDGSIQNIKLVAPSRFERLDTAALDAVKKVGKFRPIPAELNETRMDITVPVKFTEI